MSETYVECLIARKTSVMAKLGRLVLIMLAVAFAIIFFLFSGTIASIIALVLAVICGVGAYFVFIYSDVEYEYLYLDKSIYVDRIYGKSKRKRVASFDLEKVEVFAPVKSVRLDNYNRRTDKAVDYSIGYAEQPDKRYVLYYNGNQKILLSPSEELVKAARTVAPHKVFME